jgi:hypothetical protein
VFPFPIFSPLVPITAVLVGILLPDDILPK